MISTTDTAIAGKLTAQDWAVRKTALKTGDGEAWESAFKDFFYQRLKLRYLDPICALQKKRQLLWRGLFNYGYSMQPH